MPCTPPVHQISRFILDIRSHRYFSKICSIYIGNETGKDGKPAQRCILKLVTAAQNWDLLLMDLRIFHLGDEQGEHLSVFQLWSPNCPKAAQWGENLPNP